MLANSLLSRMTAAFSKQGPDGAGAKRRGSRRRGARRLRLDVEALEPRLALSSSLGTTSLVEGPAAGQDSDLVAASGAWTATSNAPWLHTTSSGTGNGLAVFTFDANSGDTRSGTLTIAGQTLTVTQAGSSYVAANPVTSLASGALSGPYGAAADRAGNVYIADFNNNALKVWNATSQTLRTLVGQCRPMDVTVDEAGNVYFVLDDGKVNLWNATTQTVSTLVSGLPQANGVGVDGAGNVYITAGLDPDNSTLLRWDATTKTVSTLVPPDPNGSSLLEAPWGVAVDGAGNVYIADMYHGAIKEWNVATQSLSTLVSGVGIPSDVELDGAGNFYIADSFGTLYGSPIRKWNATDGLSTLVSSKAYTPRGLARDSSGNLYFTDWDRSQLVEWNATTGTVRTVVDQIQANLPESPAGVAVDNSGNVYIANRDTTWTGGVNAVLKWNATTQAVGNLGIGGLSQPRGVAVDGSGNVYIADSGNNAIKAWNPTTQTVTNLVTSGLNRPQGVALDGSGNVYIADSGNNAIKEWNATTHAVSTLVSSGLNDPSGVAVDRSGNVYIADCDNRAIKEWNATTHTVSTLVSGLSSPYGENGVAVDGSGNVYIADTGSGAILKWTAATQSLSTLASEPTNPEGVAVDGAGNIYFTDESYDTVYALPRAFVPGGAVSEGAAAGSDQLLPVLPTSESLTGTFAPRSDQDWLTIGSVSGGVIHFSFSQNTSGATRTAHIGVLGQSITVDQASGPATPTITWTNPADITYGTALGDVQLDATADVPGTFAYSPAAGTVLQAGQNQTLSVIFTPADSTNYTTATTSVAIDVGQALPTVTATDPGGTYNSNPFPVSSATVTGVGADGTLASLTDDSSALSFTYYAVGANDVLMPLPDAPSNAGSYQVVAHFASDNSNYTSADSNPFSFTVTPYAFTYQIGSDSQTYGSPASLADDLPGTVSTGVNDEDLNISYSSTGDTAAASVGTYAITGTLASGSGLVSNYDVTLTDGTLTVNAAPLTITASNQSKTYGTAGDLGTTAFTTGTLYNGDTVSSVTLASPGTAATAPVSGSPYSIACSDAQGAGLGNYAITYADGALTVSPAPLTITASNQSKTYGTAWDLGTTAFTTGTLYNGDTVSSVTLTSAGAAATAAVSGSPYSIAGNDAQGTGLGNYAITYADGTLTVSPVLLTITADNQSKSYGTALDLGTTAFTSGTLYNGDTVNSVTLTSAGAEAAAPKGTYAIVPSDALGTGLTNYAVSYANGTLTVQNVPPSVAADNASVTVDEAATAANTGTFSDPGVDLVTLSASIGTVVDNGDGTWNWSFDTSDGPDDSQTVTITATDSDGAAAVATFAMAVNNVPPSVSSVTLTVEENSPHGTPVGTVVARDPGNDVLHYSIVGGSSAGAFAIDAGTGVITVADATQLDFETAPSFTVDVQVADEDGGAGTARVTVNLLNEASISGAVFVDVNRNGLYEANEPGIDGIILELLDELGVPVLDNSGHPVTATTHNGGFHLFEDLAPGTYRVHEIQPSGVNDGVELLGSLGGSIPANDTMQLSLQRTDAVDYVFSEIGQQLTRGDTAGIGFWQNRNGQALITQGGPALAAWLTDNFHNVFGNAFVGAGGAAVAQFFQQELFKQSGSKSAGPAKVDAQFMAVALATFFTSRNLAGDVATAYGFRVTDTGIGTKVVNVGNNGAAFNVANGTDMTIMQLLAATNALTDAPGSVLGFARIYDRNGDGRIDSAEAALRVMANDLYSQINEQGGL